MTRRRAVVLAFVLSFLVGRAIDGQQPRQVRLDPAPEPAVRTFRVTLP